MIIIILDIIRSGRKNKKNIYIGTSIEHAFNNNVMKIIYGIYGFYDDKLKKIKSFPNITIHVTK